MKLLAVVFPEVTFKFFRFFGNNSLFVSSLNMRGTTKKSLIPSFRDSNWVRLFVNSIHWLAEKPVPRLDAKIKPIDAGTVMNTVYK